MAITFASGTPPNPYVTSASGIDLAQRIRSSNANLLKVLEDDRKEQEATKRMILQSHLKQKAAEIQAAADLAKEERSFERQKALERLRHALGEESRISSELNTQTRQIYTDLINAYQKGGPKEFEMAVNRAVKAGVIASEDVPGLAQDYASYYNDKQEREFLRRRRLEYTNQLLKAALGTKKGKAKERDTNLSSIGSLIKQLGNAQTPQQRQQIINLIRPRLDALRNLGDPSVNMAADRIEQTILEEEQRITAQRQQMETEYQESMSEIRKRYEEKKAGVLGLGNIINPVPDDIDDYISGRAQGKYSGNKDLDQLAIEYLSTKNDYGKILSENEMKALRRMQSEK